MGELRLGLLGAGRWGRAYIRTVGALDGVRLAAVASANPNTRSLVPPACVVTQDWRAVAAMPDVDAIVVATPPKLHAEMAMAALTAGKPVLVEKPFTCDLAEAESVAALAEKRGLVLMVEHTHLFAPAFRGLAERVPALGKVRAIRGQANADGPVRPDVSVLWDWGPHDIAMCLDLMGNPARQSARRLARRNGLANAETIAIKLEWASDAVADLTVSNIAAPKRRTFEVVCMGGTLIYDDLAAAKLVYIERSGDAEAVPVASDPPLSMALTAFVKSARLPPDRRALALACDVVRVLSLCERSMTASS